MVVKIGKFKNLNEFAQALKNLSVNKSNNKFATITQGTYTFMRLQTISKVYSYTTYYLVYIQSIVEQTAVVDTEYNLLTWLHPIRCG